MTASGGDMRLDDLYRAVRARLRDAGIDSADLDARLLIAHALGHAPQDVLLKPDAVVRMTPALDAAVSRRLRREPVSRIIGHREFYGLDFTVTADVLDPRPDTEMLVDIARRHIKPGARILDLCTGSGCILAALLSLCPGATGVAADISDRALLVAETNFRALGLDRRVQLVHSDWLSGVTGDFDCITCNPPYIETGVIETLDDDVRLYDPALALDGGPDGLAPYRIVFPQIRGLLRQGGVALFEIGAAQGADVARLAQASALQVIGVERDLAGHERVVVLR